MPQIPRQRDSAILERIISYCDEIDDAMERFGNAKEALQGDVHYRNTVAMSILQIGELTTHLTEEFRTRFSEVPWKKIRNMRNIAAHHYGKFDVDVLWATIADDIDPLRDYCKQCIIELTAE
jgi:uncharacterized protein with HEPN domain